MNTELSTKTVERAVEDATQKLQIRDIVENAKNVKRLTNKLCEQLAQVEDILEDIVETYDLTDSLEEFDFRGFGLRWCGSRLAEYIHIVYVDNILLLPRSSSEVGNGFYYHHDYNASYEFMYRELVLDFANSLKEFLQNFNEKLVKIAKESEIEIPAISIS